MEKRVEYKKTIVFSTPKEKELYDAITLVESEKTGQTQSAFVLSHILTTFLPKHPAARCFCKRLYLSRINGEGVFDILSDVFLFIAKKSGHELYCSNRVFIYMIYEYLKEDIRLRSADYQDIADATKFYGFFETVVKLAPQYVKGVEVDQEMFLNFYASEGNFYPKRFLKFILDYWGAYAYNQDLYTALGQLCRLLQDPIDDLDSFRRQMLFSIKWLSEHRWEFDSD